MADNTTQIEDNRTEGEFFDSKGQITDIDMNCVEQLTDGLVDLYVPQVHLFEYTLNELVSDQQSLITAMERELQSTSSDGLRDQLNQTLNKVPLYQQKVNNLEREMRALQSKCSKLSKRAYRLAEQREKREMDRLEQKRREIEREKQLEAKRAK
ncbi:biogenesis of lysosome-related organelles complex 1 subunit 6 [Oopsacas minuta]|uniref:Biogenesis of lysosome-related organelles complex 1 subunit 6 n=1 Tax=Oopsacas minuta TaxID=111878 RepID=A0AAV7JDA1_9METZ|nr:biogenesis of lysosome-related organelles complex 1 subunit 6 [Oopsacas minuta]